MAAETIEPLDGEFSGVPQLELVVDQEVAGRAFNDAVIAYWKQALAYRQTDTGWKTVYHHPEADWVYPHLEQLRQVADVAINAA